MSCQGRSDASIQNFLPPTPHTSPIKRSLFSPSAPPPIGDGFTAGEVSEALKPKSAEAWQPVAEYVDRDIRDLDPGPAAVTFMGRVANIFDVTHTPKTPQSAQGCVKLCVKDDTGAITVSLRGLFEFEGQ